MVKPELKTDCHKLFKHVLFGLYRFKNVGANVEIYGNFHINIQAPGSLWVNRVSLNSEVAVLVGTL